MQTLFQKFKSELNRLINSEKSIAVAISGGSDSMALALLLGEYAKESGAQITAITVDHKLRVEAALEAKQVGLWLKKYGIKHHILCWEGEKKSSNIQAEARKARYRLMSDFCAVHNIKLLAVAHTCEDQAETVLMRLMRGSGVDGLSGISDSSDVFGIKLIRPLLGTKRAELREYLHNKSQKWIDDPSNENIKYKRVEVRKFIKASEEPELLTKRLVDTSAHMARAKDYIEQQIRKNLIGIFAFNEAGFYTIDRNCFRNLHPEERLRSLAAALQHAGGQDYRPRFENLNQLHDNIISGNIGSGCTLWGCEISQSKKKHEENILYIYRETSLIAENIAVQPNSQIVWDDRFICQIGAGGFGNLFIGALRIEGYKSILEGNKDFKNVTNPTKKIIYTIPALQTLEKVLAVPHIGYYADERLKQAFSCKVKEPPNLFVI